MSMTPAADCPDLDGCYERLLEEHRTEPWRRETGIVGDEEENVVYLTNDDRDTLILTADDVARFVNHAIARGDAFILDGELRLTLTSVGSDWRDRDRGRV